MGNFLSNLQILSNLLFFTEKNYVALDQQIFLLFIMKVIRAESGVPRALLPVSNQNFYEVTFYIHLGQPKLFNNTKQIRTREINNALQIIIVNCYVYIQHYYMVQQPGQGTST